MDNANEPTTLDKKLLPILIALVVTVLGFLVSGTNWSMGWRIVLFVTALAGTWGGVIFMQKRKRGALIGSFAGWVLCIATVVVVEGKLFGVNTTSVA